MNSTRNIIKIIKNKAKSSNKYVFFSTLAELCSTIFLVFLVLSFASGSPKPARLLALASGVLLFQLAKAGFRALGIKRAHESAYQTLSWLRLWLVEHLRGLPLGFFQRVKAGRLGKIVGHDVEEIELYAAHAQPEIKATLWLAVLTAVPVFLIDFSLGLCLFSTLPLSILFTYLISILLSKFIDYYNTTSQKLSEDLLEYIYGIKTIKAFVSSEFKTIYILFQIKKYVNKLTSYTFIASWPYSILSLSINSGLIFVFFYGTYLYKINKLSFNKLIVAIILSNIFSSLIGKFMNFSHYKIILERSANNMREILGQAKRSGQSLEPPSPGDVVFEDVTFSYDGREEALKELNLSFAEGGVHALVGPSGSGKSTVANLVMGLWTPDRGRVTIGGADVASLSESALSSVVTYMQQDSFLFNATIEENIALGRGGARPEEIAAAADRACLGELVAGIPDGLSTVVGEGGLSLSGGERQRVAIARAILKDSPVLLLDEPTSGIDPRNESLVQEALARLARGKTVIVIAHRLKTVEDADTITVMSSGRAIATGTHEELSRDCPLYRELLAAQSAVDEWDLRRGADA